MKTSTLDSLLVSIPIHRLPVAAAALDHQSVIRAANHKFARVCGEECATIAGRRLAEVVAEPDRPAVEEALNGLTVLTDRVPHVMCRVRGLRVKSPSLWLSIDVSRLGPESAFPYLACVHAIPRRRRLDGLPDRRVQARRASRGDDLAPASSAARCPEPWPPLLAELSHELRGPLNAIQGWAQLAQGGRLSSVQISRAFTVIGRNAASLSRMVENLFDLSRRAVGALVLKREVLDLNSLARLVVDSAQPAAGRHTVSLHASGEQAHLLVHGDPLRLEQVVRNLVDNAIKFTPAGGRVHVHTASTGAFAELRVIDDGLGISPDQLPLVFDPFRHDDKALRPCERGLGLGLALVRELVRLHDGDVQAFSEGKGQGSTFIVRLPSVDAAAAA
jgi:nitrogen-specific signal transduction histidine kinase